MYRGFKLNIAGIAGSILGGISTATAGKKLYVDDRKVVAENLSQYFLSDNYLDGSGLQKAWFPRSKADVFISHSHKDKELAIAFAGWLNNNLGISSFVDSCIWGYGDELLEEIDKNFCKNDGDNNYNYYKRNISTSHVHMMMASAITSMIDRTECLFFLNSPNSISYNGGQTLTESPWLYNELGQSQTIRRRFPERKLYEQRSFSKGGLIEKAFGVSYEIDLSHLSTIRLDDLEEWYDKCCQDENPGKSLDGLYKLIPPKRISN